MYTKNIIFMSLILHNLGIIHASHITDIEPESNHYLSPSYSDSVKKIDQREIIECYLYQAPSVYEDPVFNLNEASRALLTGKVNDQFIDKHIILDFYWKESIAGSAEIQEKLYTLLTKSFGTSNFMNADKANELLNIALSQKQTWAYRQQGMINEQKGNETLALKHYIPAAHRNDDHSKTKVNLLLNYDPNKILLNNESSNKDKELYIKKWEKLGYGIPLYDFFQKYLNINYDLLNHSFLKKSSDLGYILSKFQLGNHYLYKGDYKKSLSFFKQAADEGHMESQVQTA